MRMAEQGFQCRQVQIFDGQAGHGQLIESNPFHRATQFGNQLSVGLPVGGAEAHIDALFRTFCSQPVGPGTAQEDFDHQQRFVLYRHNLHIGDQARCNGIRDQAAKPLLLIQGMGDAHGRTAFINHADDDPAAGCICKGDQGFYQTFWRRQVPFEFECLAFGLFQ